MKRGWYFTDDGRVRFRQAPDLTYADDRTFVDSEIHTFSTKKIAQAKRNEWLEAAITWRRRLRKSLEEQLSQNKRLTRRLLKIQRNLEKHPPLPDRVDLRDQMPPVLDQGDLNAGAACAMATIIEKGESDGSRKS